METFLWTPGGSPARQQAKPWPHLLESGEVGRVHVDAIGGFGGERADGFRSGSDFFPFFVGLERGPVLSGVFFALVLDYVDQQIVLIVLRHPIADGVNVVLFEDGFGVVAEAGFERIQLAPGGAV